MSSASIHSSDRFPRAVFVGGGIAALAGAAYLIRDGGWAGSSIQIFEEAGQPGGSLDAGGDPAHGYALRGERIFTYAAYSSTLNLLASIPSLTDPELSIRDEIVRFNDAVPYDPHCRLVVEGRPLRGDSPGLTNADRLALIRLVALPEFMLGRRRINEMFRSGFFSSPFWLRIATSCAFQPWHSAVEFRRYAKRFIREFHQAPAGIRRTPYNEYDSIVRPLVQWLKEKGVVFVTGATVIDMDFRVESGNNSVEFVDYVYEGVHHRLILNSSDLVFVTNGSMTAASSLGSMDAPAELQTGHRASAWTLWERLAAKHKHFGRPEVFSGDIGQSKWLSFTITLSDPTFFSAMQALTGDAPGGGGLVTFVDSSWLLSILLPHQPHFVDQPEDVQVLWGYGLFVDRKGDFVDKPMADCSGREILYELLGHLRFDQHREAVLSGANCVPCMMPFITSQFMPRAPGDRPAVRPRGTDNFAFIGQFCEIPDDVVFTIEYSVRSAQIAVFSLLDLDQGALRNNEGSLNPAILLTAAKTLFS